MLTRAWGVFSRVVFSIDSLMANAQGCLFDLMCKIYVHYASSQKHVFLEIVKWLRFSEDMMTGIRAATCGAFFRRLNSFNTSYDAEADCPRRSWDFSRCNQSCFSLIPTLCLQNTSKQFWKFYHNSCIAGETLIENQDVIRMHQSIGHYSCFMRLWRCWFCIGYFA